MAKRRKKNGHRLTTAVGPALARVGDPLIMPDGRVIEPTPSAPEIVDKPHTVKPSQFKATKRRSLDEMPADTKVMNGIICVLMYTLLGVGNREIADALGVQVQDIQQLKKHAGYAEAFEWIRDEFINVNSELLHARIAAYGHGALTQVANIAFAGKHEGNRLKAGVDLLDRGGVTKKEAKGGGMADALRIVVTNSDSGSRTEVSVGGNDIIP